MTDPNAYIPEDSPNLEFIYNNESTLKPMYWPVFYSELVNKQDARELYNDDNTQYITYSGTDWKSLMVSKQKDGRYRNFTIRSFSGESFNFYLEVGSLYDINKAYYSGPVAVSGSYNTLVYYSGEASAQSNSITFTAPSDNSSVFVLPEVSTANYIKLHHKAVSSGETYRLYQFLPRTLIQVDDLEADVISAVTVRVQDSIVIGPDMIGDKTILGQKIVDGTVSGILLTDGTITGSKIQANTISGALITAGTITSNLIAVSGIDADRINVTTLSALATNTGSLNVTGTITVSGASSEIDAGFTKITQSGIAIGRVNDTLPSGSILKFLGRPNSALINTAVAGFYIPNDSTSPPTERLIASLGVSQYNTNVTDFIVQQNDSAGVVINMPNVDGTDPQKTAFAVRIGSRAYGNANASEPQLAVTSTEVRAYSTPIKLLSAAANNFWPAGSIIERVALANTGITVKDNVSSTTFSVSSTTGDTYVGRDLTVFRNLGVGPGRLLVEIGGSLQLGRVVFAGDPPTTANYLNYNYNAKTKDTAQTVNAGADGIISFQVNATNAGLTVDTQPWIDTDYAGFYVLTAGVVSSNVTGQTWQATLNSNTFGTGVIMNGVTQSDNRAYTTKLIYLAGGARVRLIVRNSSATNMTVSIGGNGTILSLVKVG